MPTRGAEAVPQPAARALSRGGADGTSEFRGVRRSPDGPREETSLLGFINVLLRHRRLLAFCAVVGAAILGFIELRAPRLYVAYASFTVRGSRPPTLASQLAAQLGLSLGTGSDDTQALAFYIDLVRSASILKKVVEVPYVVSTPQGSVQRSLASALELDGQGAAIGRAKALTLLHDRVSATTWAQTGIVLISVGAERRELAPQILANVLRDMDAYNIAQRQNRAAEERDFVERMLNEARAALTRAEDQLSNFRQLNREYTSSPALTLENDRLMREVDMRQQVYTAMAQTYEQAKIEGIRDSPSITVLDSPAVTVSPDNLQIIRKALLGVTAGLLVGIVLAFLRERTAEQREAPTEAYVEFLDLKKQAIGGVAQP